MASANDVDQALALKALRLADLKTVAHVQSVWDDSIGLAEALHRGTREKLLKAFSEAPEFEFYEAAAHPNNPGIKVYTGVGGAGKTQMLSQIRKSVMSAGNHFVLIDMTGVNRFYPTVCLEMVKSLLQRTPKGYSQLDLVLANLFRFIEETRSEEEAVLKFRSAVARSSDFDDIADQITNQLSLRFASNPFAMKIDSRKDVLRALLILGSPGGDERADAAFDWLQGGELEDASAKSLKLSSKRIAAYDTIKAVTWLMGFRARTMIAFDQLDVIVNQFETASRGGNTEVAAAAKGAVIEIVGGLADLSSQVYRGQILISCLQQTWATLKGNILSSVMDRFVSNPVVLAEISDRETAKRIIELRLQPAYKRVNFEPPFATFPFTERFFEVGLTPRSLLQRCSAYRDQCIEAGEILDPEKPPGDGKGGGDRDRLNPLDREYKKLSETMKVETLDAGTDASESAMGKLLDQVCDMLRLETPPPKDIQAKIDLDPASLNKTQVGLHARLCLIFFKQNDREEFFCFRALQHPHATSFQARLRAAITDSGVNLKLPFRRLVIVRNQPLPRGPKTKELVDELGKLGGRILPVAENELRALAAVKALSDKNDKDFADWLRDRRPLGQLSFIRSAFQDYFALIKPTPTQTEEATSKKKPATEEQTKSSVTQARASCSIVLGRLLSPLDNRPIELPIASLTRHLLIRAGAGGGKTVLLKRLIESAALCGVPSIVLDPGNDLAFLGDAWPTNPAAWLKNDPARAAAYHERVEVVVWTPGRASGRPLRFSPLPDFSAVLDDGDDFESAVVMAAGSLFEATGAAKGAGSNLKTGILTEGIRHFAKMGGKTLPDLVRFLRDLPLEAQGEIAKAPKLAQDMADTLQATLLSSKTLMPESGSANLSEVLGIGAKKTRVSVVSLAGLSETNGDRLAFVNQLAVLLFTWIRKNPSQEAGGVRGLLVVDEAKDFIPSVKSTACKDSLMRVAAQARKYGFGLMLATQNPTDIDHKVANNCATQFFGRAASPNVVDAMRQAIEERGGSAPDLTQLGKGQFYFSSAESQSHPIRIQVPLCLSYHPDGRTLTESEIMARAKRPVEQF